MKSEILCTCFNLTKADILAAIKARNLQTVEEIGDATLAGTVCGACIDKLRETVK
ncbi:MAG: (2Fe-2S)-binding protein [Prevotellaceae bacterium]|jgi:NAD(P)H-nitrite reductase large subunit|nr:(2Fe-2S)-binding protein [Prevotellaceae bacterium]